MMDYWVSIHAPAGGATGPFLLLRLHLICFNPRSRGGSDAFMLAGLNAPCRFNPRSRGGSDMPKIL